jgi:hypothetical protein
VLGGGGSAAEAAAAAAAAATAATTVATPPPPPPAPPGPVPVRVHQHVFPQPGEHYTNLKYVQLLLCSAPVV